MAYVLKTRAEIEAALDAGKLELQTHGGSWWRARRNGATKLWKTRPDEFSIPVKAGLRATCRIDHASIYDFHYRIAE